jgi:hypothetical protein
MCLFDGDWDDEDGKIEFEKGRDFKEEGEIILLVLIAVRKCVVIDPTKIILNCSNCSP